MFLYSHSSRLSSRLSLFSMNYRWMDSILSDFMNEIVEENIVGKCIRGVIT